MKRVIIEGIKGKIYYTVQTRFKLFGFIPLWWATDIIDEAFYTYKASYSTLKEAEEYINSCYQSKIDKIIC